MDGKINNVYIKQGCNVPNLGASNNVSFRSKEIKDSFESTTKRNNNGKVNSKISLKQAILSKLSVSFKGVSSNSETTSSSFDPKVELEALKQELSQYSDYSERDKSKILDKTTESNVSLVRILCADRVIEPGDVSWTMRSISSAEKEDIDAKIKIYNWIKQEESLSKEQLRNLLGNISKNNVPFLETLYLEGSLPLSDSKETYNFWEGVRSISDEVADIKTEMFSLLKEDKSFSKEQTMQFLSVMDNENAAFIRDLYLDDDYPNDYILTLFPKKDAYSYYDRQESSNTRSKIELYDLLKKDEEFPKEEIPMILQQVKSGNISLAKKLSADKTFPKEKISYVLEQTSQYDVKSKLEMYDYLQQLEEFPKEEIPNILRYTEQRNLSYVKVLCTDKTFPKGLVVRLLCDRFSQESFDSKIKMFDILQQDEDFPKDKIPNVLNSTNDKNIDSRIEMYNSLKQNKDFPTERISDVLRFTNGQNLSFAKKICADETFPRNLIPSTISWVSDESRTFAEELYADEKFPNEQIIDVLIDKTYYSPYGEDWREGYGTKIEIYNLLKQDESFPSDKMCDTIRYGRNLPRLAKMEDQTLFEKAMKLASNGVYNTAEKLLADDFYYNRMLELSLKPNMFGNQVVNFAQVENPEEYALISEMANYLHSDQISKLREENRLVDISDSPEYKQNKDSILATNSNKELTIEAKNHAVNILLGLYNDDYSKLTLKEKMMRVDELKQLQVCPSLSDEVRNLLEIDNKIIKLREAIKTVISTTQVSNEDIVQMMSGFFSNNNQDVENTLSTANFSKYGKAGLPLKYPRQNFLNDLSNILKNISEQEKTDILNKLGITLVNNSTGYDGIIDLSKLSSEGIEGEVLSIATEFIKENSVSTGDEKLDAALNSLIQGMPEFINVIGKKQHQTHDYSVDVHILTVLKEVMRNPEYQNLSNQDKFCLKFATVLHDIAKAEEIDEEHAQLCSLYAKDIINKFAMPYEIKDRIYELVKNHHWLADYNKGEVSANQIAVLFRRSDDLKMAQIMAEADLKGVDAKNAFYANHSYALSTEKQKPIENAINGINRSGQIFLTNKIINQSKVPVVQHNGEEYKVINFTQLPKDTDLEQFGFEAGTTVENLRIWLHMVNERYLNDLNTLYDLQDPSNEGLLCASVASIETHPTYQNNKFGVSLESEQVNIANASEVNQKSGFEKGFSKFGDIITGQDDASQHRKLVPITIKQALKLSDKEYADLFAKIQKYKYSSQLDNVSEIKVGDKTFTGKQIKEAISNANDMMIKRLTIVCNEANLYSPKINAVVAKVASMEEMPQELLNYAKKYNLPIYLLGK